ncbi:MAG: 23S rRNA (uracil(1939)-C(5))-methyltransferase RlmD [Lachnospiraceae bacterium]|nr:23S rRNA (uracil(1939)-C(5))-methyltransferase RlmD [Lachnospiraceae bacterium]
MLKKNDTIKLYIEDITNDGEGVGKLDGFVWFVKDTIPGDEIEAIVMKQKKSYGYARLKSVIKESTDRICPKCQKARACGGCTLQCMDYKTQLKFKRNKVKNNLMRIGGFDGDFIEGILAGTVGMDEPWRYRNKAIVPVGKDKNGNITAGFYAAHSHDIIECEDCFLQPPEFKEIIKETLKRYGNTMTHILLRKGYKTGQVMAYAVENHDTNAVLSGKLTHVYGDEVIEDYIGDLKFKISPRSFFQVNPVQVEKLYGKALEYAELTGNETVWDLYCGTGTITLSLARNARRVYGVEIVEDAIKDAVINAEENGIDNAVFYVGKAEEVTLRDDFEKPDVVVVDPPRKGCDSVCLDTIIRMNPERVVYVSCDSATLARDLRILCDNGYELRKATPVDMFPQTVHIETVCLLIDQNAKHHVNAGIDAGEY